MNRRHVLLVAIVGVLYLAAGCSRAPRTAAVQGSPGAGASQEAGGNVKVPVLVTKITPKYPTEARQAGIEGTVVLEAIITAEGNVEDVRVVRSIPELDQSAIDAFKKWKYTPAVQNGRPVKVNFTVEINFALP